MTVPAVNQVLNVARMAVYWSKTPEETTTAHLLVALLDIPHASILCYDNTSTIIYLR